MISGRIIKQLSSKDRFSNVLFCFYIFTLPSSFETSKNFVFLIVQDFEFHGSLIKNALSRTQLQVLKLDLLDDIRNKLRNRSIINCSFEGGTRADVPRILKQLRIVAPRNIGFQDSFYPTDTTLTFLQI